MTRIVRALPDQARLYFIGDADQLPAVELGNVLEQLVSTGPASFDENANVPNGTNSAHSSPSLNSHDDGLSLGGVPSLMRQHIATLCPHLPLLPVDEQAKSYVATLQAPQRFKGQVAKVATAIQRGDASGALAAITDKAGDNNESAGLGSNTASRLQSGVYLWPELQVSGRDLQQLAKESFLPIFDAGSAEEALNRLNVVRWLTPVRKGGLGVEGLNNLVFDAIKHKIRKREGHFYQGQPIMIVKNHHPQRLSNGEVGVIWPDSKGKLYAWFYQDSQASANAGDSADKTLAQKQALRSISLSRVPQFETVYAMTIHKSQGSEFNHVVLILPKPDSEKAANLFHRGLVYTGLTRAKDGCLIISDNATFTHMVQRVDKRYSGLSEAISLQLESTSNATPETE
jgi:exodeoxyribonuclease V alpha subunit